MLRPETERIDRLAGEVDLVVQVGSSGPAAAAGASDDLSSLDPLPIPDQQRVVVAIGRHHPTSVIENQDLTIDSVAARAPDDARAYRPHGSPDGRTQVHAGVHPH